jgi:UDP-glucuronate 4-epimerase
VAVLVTGVAGFIGYHVAQALLQQGESVLGIDNLNAYYDVRLKQARLDLLAKQRGFEFCQADVADRHTMFEIVRINSDLQGVIHLAAQAGVRHSLIDPYAYVESNVMGHLVVMEAARRLEGLRHLVYASSSSVYGANDALPFSEADRVDTPMSLYAATKRADELMSHAYGHLHQLPQTGLRFFTVYGPWGRPDMAYYSFARAICAGEPITVYDGGMLKRDFTYVDDIVAGVIGCFERPPAGALPVRILNIGNHQSELVSTLVALLEQSLGKRAILRDAPRPAADVEETCADVSAIAELTGFAPRTSLAEGIPRFVAWFRAWHGLNR